jgi:hypothetical protein
VVCEVQLIINYNSTVLAELDGVMDDEPIAECLNCDEVLGWAGTTSRGFCRFFCRDFRGFPGSVIIR